jgi:hypothetical protein
MSKATASKRPAQYTLVLTMSEREATILRDFHQDWLDNPEAEVDFGAGYEYTYGISEEGLSEQIVQALNAAGVDAPAVPN